MKLSALVCTYKRPSLVTKLLADMEAAAVEPGDWELIVVDNAGDAKTREVCRSHPLVNTKLKYVFEPKTGLSSAKNRAVKESQGEYLLFLDDDVSFKPDFIKQMLEAIEKHNADIICPKMITPVSPDWPKWLKFRLSSGVGQFNLGESETKLDQSTKIPVGACVCCKRSVYDESGPFAENLDRLGGKPFGGGETLFFWKAFQAGATGIYLPHFTINHEFITEKNTKKYWRGQGFYGGRSRVRMLEYTSPDQLSRLNLLMLAGSSIFKSAIRFLVMVLNPGESFENQYRGIAHFGIAYEAIAIMFSSRRPKY